MEGHGSSLKDKAYLIHISSEKNYLCGAVGGGGLEDYSVSHSPSLYLSLDSGLSIAILV